MITQQTETIERWSLFIDREQNPIKSKLTFSALLRCFGSHLGSKDSDLEPAQGGSNKSKDILVFAHD